MLGFEAQQVIILRSLKLLHGGRGARAEATRMVTEKAVAATRAIQQTASGKSPDHVISGVRRKVRANRKRLSRSTG